MQSLEQLVLILTVCGHNSFTSDVLDSSLYAVKILVNLLVNVGRFDVVALSNNSFYMFTLFID
jgi:hypothetical protein